MSPGDKLVEQPCVDLHIIRGQVIIESAFVGSACIIREIMDGRAFVGSAHNNNGVTVVD